MHHTVDELRNTVSGFRASEREAESEQLRVYLGRAQELASMEQQVVSQAVLVAQAEQKISEEHSAMHRNMQISEHGLREELAEARSGQTRNWLEFMSARKEADALNRELLRSQERISDMRQAFEQANSAPSMGS